MGTEPGLAYQNDAMPQAGSQRPYYQSVGNEETVFKAAYRQGLSLVLKGTTGCGKTRFVEAMAHDLGRPLITVACHDDLTTADLVGRYLLQGDETVWVDGPLTRGPRHCRPHPRGPGRSLSAAGRRDGVGGRSADPRGARGRDLLSRRSG